MRLRVALLLTFGVLLAAAFRREAVSQPNLVKQVAPGVYYREAEREKRIIANTGWVVFRDYVVVVDANYPWGARAVLSDLKKTTDKPIKFVFDTHYHGDHAHGNSVWVDAGATVVCSEDCAEESLRKNTASWAKNTETGEFSLKPYRLEHPQVTFRDRLVLDDGAMRVELIRIGPAHTRGDAIAYLPKQRILFTGDVAVNQAGNNMADVDADHDNWVRALDALSARDVMTVVPGHGALGTAETLRGQRAYIAAVVNGVRAGIQKGTPLEQIQKELDLAAHKPWGQNPTSNQNSIRAVYGKLSQQK
jgi:glyoxylase-like metal-dependent hydrolase (beta-lactamase superfamily II)